MSGPATPAAAGVRRVAVVGTGVIGASWTALFLAHGLEVVATDPAPGAAERLRAALGAAGDSERLTVVADPADAVAGADFVQENAPERVEAKHALFAVLDAATRPDVVIASSSSGIPPSTIAEGCPHHPGRVLVGHPFNPPHLVPLVEVVPGVRTDERTVARALAFYTAVGRRPIRLRAEVPGHVANRLQAALWQEAYSLVERGVATVADIDAAVTRGPGLRWAVLGPFLAQHVSGGAGGIAHVLEHLGPPTEAWWRDLRDVTLTPELVELLVAGVDAELTAAGLTDPAELLARRDAALGAVLDATSGHHLP